MFFAAHNVLLQTCDRALAIANERSWAYDSAFAASIVLFDAYDPLFAAYMR